MKKTISVSLIILCVMMAFAGCFHKGPTYVDGTARYTKDTTLGSGSKTITVTVTENEEFSVTFTIKTDAKTVGDALLENKLIAGDAGAYGLYVKVVNGLRADYDKDHAFWGFTINGEDAMTGVDGENIIDGGVYGLVYKIG